MVLLVSNKTWFQDSECRT